MSADFAGGAGKTRRLTDSAARTNVKLVIPRFVRPTHHDVRLGPTQEPEESENIE